MKLTNKPPFSILATALLALSLLFACQTVPETNRSQIVLIDPQAEFRLGVDAYKDALSKAKLSKDMRMVGILRRVGWNIANVTHQPDYRWEFNLLETQQPNAFCLPGGKVAVNTGILPIARNEAGLAVVLGHEIAHAIARHGAERLSHNMLIALGGELLAQGMGRNRRQRELIRVAYGYGSAIAFTLPFSRSHELEADHLGLLYMARAGYDPREAKLFWKRFADYARSNSKGSTPEFLSTHPTDQNRIVQIDRFLPTAMGEYEKSSRIGIGENLM